MIQLIEFLGSDLTTALGWTFVHTLWQGSLIALMMMVILAQIPQQNALLRYKVAVGSLLSILIVAGITFLILYPFVQAAPAAISSSAVTAAGLPQSTGLMQWIDANLPVLVAIWLVGMLILTVKLGLGLLYIEKLKRASNLTDQRLRATVKRISGQLQYSRAVRIAETTRTKIPVVVGLVKPVILFPLGAVNQLTPAEVEAVLAHEIAHLVRNDFVQNLIQSFIEIIFYYHPAVWWISAMVRAERENCCDDLAIKACGNSLTYAKALVQLQDLGQTSPALALPFSGSDRHLLNRIKRILNQPQNKSNVMEKITATCLLVVCLMLVSFSGFGDTPQQDNSNNTNDAMEIIAMVTDTVPTRYVIRKRSADGDVRATFENGALKQLQIDGDQVPEADYAMHQDLIDKLKHEVKNVPPPPPPPPLPDFPDMPPMHELAPLPDMPPHPEMPAVPEAAPEPGTPPMPPQPLQDVLPTMPPPPPPPPAPGIRVEKRNESLIIREENQDGSHTYRIESDGDGVDEIVIDQARGTAVINGSEVTLNADTVIVIEEIEQTMPNGLWTRDNGKVGIWKDSDTGENIFLHEGQLARRIHSDKEAQYLYELKFDESLSGEERKGKIAEYKKLLDESRDNRDRAVFLLRENAEHSDPALAKEYLEKARAYKLRREGGLHEKEDFEISKEGLYQLELQEGGNVIFDDNLHFSEGDVSRQKIDEKPFVYELKRDNVFFRHRDGGNPLVGQMAKEGLIDPEGDYSIVLTENKLKVNGQKLSDEELERYKKIYQKISGFEISGKTKIEIENKVD